MLRTLFAIVCLQSLLVGSVAAVVARYSRRAGHAVIWRIDAAAEAEGAHASLASAVRQAWRTVPGPRHAGKPAPRSAVTREYASLVLADGVVEYRRYPEPPWMAET